MAAAVPAKPSVLFRDTSELDIDPATRIISFSDIHGDLDALIIALRDCARVIKPRSNIPNAVDNKRDPELERLLNLNLNDIANMKEFDAKSDLDFEWIGDNTHVVIIGDLIDPVRRNVSQYGYTVLQTAISSPPKRNVNDVYPQVEIKILKFLNKLDEIANIHGGRVIKLIGNHEIANFKNIVFNSSSYYGNLYSHDSSEPIPYIDVNGDLKTIVRRDFFNLNNPGFKLFMERGSGVFLRINNTLFIHGQVYDKSKPSFNFKKCDNFNKWLNSGVNLIEDQIFDDFANSAKNPQLWDREFGDDEDINRRLLKFSESKVFCDKVTNNIENFLTGNAAYPGHPLLNTTHNLTPKNMRVVIGHCPQTFSTWYNEINKTFITQTQLDNVVELTMPSQIFKADETEINKNNVFGISMECLNGNDHKVYKVDIGTSRAFDQDALYNVSDHTTMKKYFLGRVPQVLQFQGDDVRIIRSTLKNTRIHQIRQEFENIIDEKILSGQLPQDMSIPNMTYGGYKEKYMKYKAKYLELKKKITK